jgi:hypothetical protein
MRRSRLLAVLAACAAIAGCASWTAMNHGPSFFVTSSNPGRGANFGGLAGADAHCQALASAAGFGSRTWHAYLSTTGADAVNARDRVGKGPWFNVKGVQIAANVDELHGTNQLAKQTALTERGDTLSGVGDPVNVHDVLTGSTPEGRATVGGTADTTCGNWTKDGDGSAIVGHLDRRGLRDDAPSQSWNSSHATRGCSLPALKSTGGGGLLYCFAVN